MAKYYRQQGETRQRRILKFVRPLMFILFLIVFIAGALFLYDIFGQTKSSTTASEASKPVSSTIVENIQIQTSPYFQLQTPNKWRAVTNETRDGHYVYRQYNGPLVEQEIVIDVNNQSQELLALTHINRVLPVTVSDEGFIDVANTDLAHCKKATKPGTEKTQQILVMEKVSFPCNPDFTGYEAVVGLVNGSNIMHLPRPDGTKAFYKILYRNVSATPNSRDIISIIKTFETR